MKKVEDIKKVVFKANQELVDKRLVIQSFGNVSERYNKKCIIKPSGIEIYKTDFSKMVPVNIDDGSYNGSFKPSSDTPTHIELYKKFSKIQSVAHTHSIFATSWSQSGLSIPCLGTTHADYWEKEIPITRSLTKKEIETGYEKNTGLVIVETLSKLRMDPLFCPGILVKNHGVFSWGKSSFDAVNNAELIEYIAEMAYRSMRINSKIKPLNKDLHRKHFNRKHGDDKYYGQK